MNHSVKSFRPVLMVFCALFLSMSFGNAEAQILKKIGQKMERSIERRVENKIDKGVEKSLDKVEEGMDQAAKDAVTGKEKDEKEIKGSKKPTGNVDILVSAEEAESKGGLVLATSNCNEFAWFKSGAVLEYKIKDEGEKEFTSRMEVKSVKQSGGETTATVAVKADQLEELEVDYICSGNKMYFDLSGAMKSKMKEMNMDGHQVEMEFEGGMMAIPKNMYPGMKLEDVEFKMNTSMSGMTMTMTVLMTDRKVEKRETIVTPAGTFNCIKVTGTQTVKSNMMGMNRTIGKPTTEEMWFASRVGIVKSVSKSSKGKIESLQELTFLSY